MSHVPKYLMDRDQFYWNPEYPGLLIFPPDFTPEDIKNTRIPVRIFRNSELVVPGTNLPKHVEENTRVLPD